MMIFMTHIPREGTANCLTGGVLNLPVGVLSVKPVLYRYHIDSLLLSKTTKTGSRSYCGERLLIKWSR